MKRIMITLVNPFWSHSNVYVPSNLAQLAGYLRMRNIEVSIVDLNFEMATERPDGNMIDMCIDLVAKEKPSALGIISDTIHLPFCNEFIPAFKARYKDVPVILGGNHASMDYARLFEILPVDYIVIGEGEETLAELAMNLGNKESYRDIKGLVYKDNDGVRVNRKREPMDISILPLLAYDLLPDLRQYFKFPESEVGVSASRGCPYSCIFCSNSNMWGLFRTRPVSQVIEEIQYLKINGIDRIAFDDNCLTTDRNWCISLLSEVEKLNIKFRCFARIDSIDDTILNKLRNAGCYRIYHGIESGSKRLRSLINKEYSELTNQKVIETVKKEIELGFKVVCSFMSAIPTETREDLKKTVALAGQIKSLGAEVQLWIMTPYPGIPALDKYEGEIIKVNRKKILNQADVFEPEQYSIFEDSLKKLEDINPDNFMFRPDMPLEEFFGLFRDAQKKLNLIKSENILLIKPPVEEVIPSIKKYQPNFFSFASQPSALLRIGAYLKSIGNEVSYIDCAAETEGRINSITNRRFIGYKLAGDGKTKQKVYHFGMDYKDFRSELKKVKKPDKILVSCSMTYHWRPAHKTIEICKEIFPESRVIFGGIYPTLCPGHAKQSQADEIFTGELPEANFFDSDLDMLDYIPSYSIIKASRGCPNKCSYCAVHLLEGNVMHHGDPDKTVNEIIDKNKKYGIREFVFWESNFLVNSERHFEKILDKIVEKKSDISLSTPEGLSPNLLTMNLARKMKKAGFDEIHMPLESSEAEMEKRFNRPSGLADFRRAVNYLIEAGFKSQKITAFILIGLPYQSLDGILDSFITAWELGCNPKVMPFTPIPGTREYEKHKDLLQGKSYEDLHPFLWPFAGNVLSVAELENICQLNRIVDPITHLKRKADLSDIDKKIVRMIKRSGKIWDIHYKVNGPSWHNDDLPDSTVVSAHRHFISPQKDKRILDIGCGFGKNSLYLKEKDYLVHGIDISDYAIKNLLKGLDKKNFSAGDFLKWNTNSRFDAVLDIGCLHTIDKDTMRVYIKKVASLLKRGGKFILRCFSEYGHQVKRFHPTTNNIKSPFLTYLSEHDLRDLIKEDFKIYKFNEIFHCSKKTEGEYSLVPGMYELFLERI